MPATMPACIIENGTLRYQRQLVTTLGQLSGKGFSSPALIVIGEVVRFASEKASPRTRKAA
jgi:siroheme synthase